MSHKQMRITVAVAVGIIAGLGLLGPNLTKAAPAVQRPIGDFVDAQGTFCFPDGMGGCFLFVPPVQNFIGWGDPAKSRLASVDYAGLANACVGGVTTTSGTVTERPLSDGRAEVHVTLHTKNALTWVLNLVDNDFATDPELFGERWDTAALTCEVGDHAALGNSVLTVKFINTAPGAPLPDLNQLLFERFEDLISISIKAQANGPLREAFGVPDGTPGRVKVTQIGLFMTPFMGAVADGFPAERIDLHVVGK